MLTVDEHIKDLIYCMHYKECNTLNSFIALLEIKKQEVINQLLGKEV